MTLNLPKLVYELSQVGIDAGEEYESINTDGVITWIVTPTQQQLDDAAAVIASHNPINQFVIDFGLSIDDMITKAITWHDFFYDNRNINFSTMDTATQDTVIKRLMFIAIYVLEDFMVSYDSFFEDPV